MLRDKLIVERMHFLHSMSFFELGEKIIHQSKQVEIIEEKVDDP